MSEFFQRLSGSAAGQVPTVTPAPLSRFAPPAGLLPEEDPFSVFTTPPQEPATSPAAAAAPLDEAPEPARTEPVSRPQNAIPDNKTVPSRNRQPATREATATAGAFHIQEALKAQEGPGPELERSDYPALQGSDASAAMPSGRQTPSNTTPHVSEGDPFSVSNLQPPRHSAEPELSHPKKSRPDSGDLAIRNQSPAEPGSFEPMPQVKSLPHKAHDREENHQDRMTNPDPSRQRSPGQASTVASVPKNPPFRPNQTHQERPSGPGFPNEAAPTQTGPNPESGDPFSVATEPNTTPSAANPRAHSEKPHFSDPKPSRSFSKPQAETLNRNVAETAKETNAKQSTPPLRTPEARQTPQNTNRSSGRHHFKDGPSPEVPSSQPGPWDLPESEPTVQAPPLAHQTPASHSKSVAPSQKASPNSDPGTPQTRAVQPATSVKKPANSSRSDTSRINPSQPRFTPMPQKMASQSGQGREAPATHQTPDSAHQGPTANPRAPKPPSGSGDGPVNQALRKLLSPENSDPFAQGNSIQTGESPTQSKSSGSELGPKPSESQPPPFSNRKPEPMNPNQQMMKSEGPARGKENDIRLPSGESVHIDKVEFQIVKQAPPPPPPPMPAPPPREKPSLSDYLKSRKAGQR